MNEVPMIFQPRNLRSGFKFNSLTRNIFNNNTEINKWLLVNEVLGLNLPRDGQVCSIMSISRRYMIPVEAILFWIENSLLSSDIEIIVVESTT